MLKIDVEGYELNVLKGAKKKLKEIPYVLIEQQFGNQYKNSDFSKVDKYLKDNNFKVVKVFIIQPCISEDIEIIYKLKDNYRLFQSLRAFVKSQFFKSVPLC